MRANRGTAVLLDGVAAASAGAPQRAPHLPAPGRPGPAHPQPRPVASPRDRPAAPGGGRQRHRRNSVALLAEIEAYPGWCRGPSDDLGGVAVPLQLSAPRRRGAVFSEHRDHLRHRPRPHGRRTEHRGVPACRRRHRRGVALNSPYVQRRRTRFTMPLRVRYVECDMQGRVFNAPLPHLGRHGAHRGAGRNRRRVRGDGGRRNRRGGRRGRAAVPRAGHDSTTGWWCDTGRPSARKHLAAKRFHASSGTTS